MKTVGKTTRPFRYDLNKIHYEYTVEVINKLNGSDLVERMAKELWMEVYNIVQEEVTKNNPMKKKYKKAKL